MSVRCRLLSLFLGAVVWTLGGCTSETTRWRQQRRTMADMRTISIALDSYARDHNGRLPDVHELLVHASSRQTHPWAWPPGAWPLPRASDVVLLRPSLEPRYVKTLPTKDVWGGAIRCAILDDLSSYTLVSFGRDGKEDTFHTTTFPPGELDRDLVLVDGLWVCFPEGTAM